MKVDFINPFLKACLNVLDTMAHVKATPGKPFLKKEKMAQGDVTGMIGLVSGKAKGSMAITFSESTILYIASQMLGEELTALDETIADLVGEITNMVTGGAKKELAENGYKFDMAIPSTIIGRKHSTSHTTKAPILVVPFNTEHGAFFIEVCMED
ncbi:MAG TPA: chemotaxis protein CheX [bacterium]|nr:chemotaxis protein CheX [bacterium]